MLPQEFLDRMEHMLGEEYPAFLESYQTGKCHALRVNALKPENESLIRQAGFHLEPIPWSENGFYFDEDDRPGRHPFHAAGVYYIQDASAQAVVTYLNAKPKERILDLCAAPGGKSTQIGAALKGQGILVCNEIHPARAKILSENIERMGIVNAIVTNETPQRLQSAFGTYFHGIVVDAPCSGEGMFRKNEEATVEWSEANVKMCAQRQDEILDCAANMLLPGGRIVYSTCTFAPAEDEETVARFLLRHPDFTLVPMERSEGMEPGRREWISEESLKNAPVENTLRLWPHKLRGEGHFIAVLKREEGELPSREPALLKGKKEKECKEFMEFAKSTLQAETAAQLLKHKILLSFGDQLYLAPEGTPVLDKLKVLRPGLHLGTVKKNRFEPSHALALSLGPKQVKYSLSLAADGPEILAYLGGQTLNPDLAEKGWYLLTADGASVGWGKYAGGIMKNHYPKGLRW